MLLYSLCCSLCSWNLQLIKHGLDMKALTPGVLFLCPHSTQSWSPEDVLQLLTVSADRVCCVLESSNSLKPREHLEYERDF